MKILDKILNRKSKNSFVLFYSYETITLKLYLEIIGSLDFKKLIAAGNADEQACAQAWDKIIAKNYQTNGGFEYLNYIDLMSGYGQLMAEYNITKASILKLIVINLEVGIVFIEGNKVFVRDDELIEELKSNGYKIDITDALKYAESLNNALRRCDNLISRLKMKSNEINKMMSDRDGGSEQPTFDSIMAFLYSQFPHVPEDITLSRYNELVKILKERNKQRINA